MLVSNEREVLTYEMFGTAARELAQEVADSGFAPDMILSIARGGLALGMGLGYALGVKNLSVINVEFYTGVDQRLEVPIVLPPTRRRVDLSGLKVLVADDVADTGGRSSWCTSSARDTSPEAHRGHLREAGVGHQARLRAAHGAVDRLPVVGAAAVVPGALAH